MRRRDRGDVGHADHVVDDFGEERWLDAGAADALDPAAGGGEAVVAALPGVVEDRVLDIDHAERRQVAIADVAPDRRRGAAGAGTHHHPFGNRLGLGLHLLEDALGDVVVAAPVGRPFGIGELVQVVAAALVRQVVCDRRRSPGVVDEMARAAEALDRVDLLRAGRARHDRDEGQAQQPREIGLRHRGRARRGLDERRAGADPAVADAVEEQRPRQPVLQAAGRMGGFVLEVDRDAAQARELGLDQMGVGRAVRVAFKRPDRVARTSPDRPPSGSTADRTAKKASRRTWVRLPVF